MPVSASPHPRALTGAVARSPLKKVRPDARS